MKRMAPLLLILVLVLAPAAWGYDVTLLDSTIGLQSKAAVGLATNSGSPTAITEPGVFKAFSAQAMAINGNPFDPTAPADTASSNWVAKVYEPVVSYGSGGVGKTTSITQVINVSMLLSFVHPYITGSAGDFASILTIFNAVREDTTTTPAASIDFSLTGVPGTSGPNASTWFYYQPPGYFPPPPVDIIPQNNAPPAEQTASAAGIANLLTYDDSGSFVLSVDLASALAAVGLPTIDPSDPSTWESLGSNLYLTETLNLIEPNMINPDAVVIPVPPSLILLGSGLLGLGVLPRLRRRIKA